MRYIVFLLLLLAPTAFIHAQASTDSSFVTNENDVVTVENEDGDEESEESLTHTLVSPDELPKTKEYKTEKIPVRKFDQTKWKKVIGTTDFEEKKEEKKLEDPKKKEEADQEKDNSTSAPWQFGGVTPIVGYIIIIIVVALILYFVVKNTKLDFNTITKPTLQADDLSAPVENIEDLDIRSLLQKTLAAGDFRLAIRMYFLDLLQRLHHQGKIAWKKDKTNRDYLTELFPLNFYYNDIRKLTLAYELVWYGEHTLPAESFKQIIADFESMQQKLNSTAS